MFVYRLKSAKIPIEGPDVDMAIIVDCCRSSAKLLGALRPIQVTIEEQDDGWFACWQEKKETWDGDGSKGWRVLGPDESDTVISS